MPKIRKWGNGQGIRLPKKILEAAALAVGDEVDVTARRGEIVIGPAGSVAGNHLLNHLVAQMPPRYLPSEVDWGAPVGKEAW